MQEQSTALPAEKSRMTALYFMSVTSLTLATAAQFATFVLLARYLGAHQFGLLTTVLAITNLAVPFCGLGAHEVVLRRVARNPKDYPAILGHALLLTLSTGVVLSLVFAAIMYGLFRSQNHENIGFVVALLFAFSNILMQTLVMLAEGVFIARLQFGLANFVNVCWAVSKLAVAFVACILFSVGDIQAWALWHGGVHFLFGVACLILVLKIGRPAWKIIPREFWLGLHGTTPDATTAFRQNIDVLVLGLVAPPAAVGAYALCKRILEASLVTIKSLTRLIYPKLASAMQESADAVLRLTLKYLKAIVLIACANAFCLFLAAPLLPTVFGKDFGAAVGILQALCWVSIWTGLQWAAFDALGACEQHRLRAMVCNAGSLMGGVAIGLGVYFFGVNGAVAAIVTAEGLIAVSLWLALARSVQSDPTRSSAIGVGAPAARD
jgi:O-antigen/teichoic acid export membrane protein